MLQIDIFYSDLYRLCVNVVNIEKTTFNGGSQKIYKLTDTTDTKDLGGSFLMGHQRGVRKDLHSWDYGY